MSSILFSKVLSASIIFALDLVSSYVPFIFKGVFAQSRNMSVAKCVSGGVLLCSSVLQLLSTAENGLGDNIISTDFPVIHFTFSLGFMSMLLIEYGMASVYAPTSNKVKQSRVMTPVSKIEGVIISMSMRNDTDDETDKDAKHAPVSFTAYVFLFIVALETIVAGMTIGVQNDTDSVWIILIAVVSHDWIEAISLSLYFIEAHSQSLDSHRKRIYVILAVFSSCTPIGVFIGMLIGNSVSAHASDVIASILAAFMAGTFLFIATIEMIAKEFSSSYESEPDKPVSNTPTYPSDTQEMTLLTDANNNEHKTDHTNDTVERAITRKELLTKITAVVIGYIIPAVTVAFVKE